MPRSTFALGMRFFIIILGNFNGLFKIPQQFLSLAKKEMRPERKGILLTRKRTYYYCITEKRGQLFMGGEGIKQLSKDFSLVAEDVVFFEYFGEANFGCWVCSGKSCMEKSFQTKTAINFFLEAGSYPHGLELPKRLHSIIPQRGNSFAEVQTRFGMWKIEISNGPSLCIMRGKCWESFCVAHRLSRSNLIQMEYHENGIFSAIVYNIDSNCEPPQMITGKPFILGSRRIRCQCKTLSYAPDLNTDAVQADDSLDEDTISLDEYDDALDEDGDSLYEYGGGGMNYDTNDGEPLDSWRKKITKHMVPDFCKKSLPRLYFPRDKWMAHHLDSKKVAILKVPQYGQRTWEVKVHTYVNNEDGTTDRVALGHGWSEFANDNCLVVGLMVEFQILRPPLKDLNIDRMYLALLILE